MTETDLLIRRVAKTKHGFTEIKKAADEVVTAKTRTESLALAKELFTSDIVQARALATFIMGKLASRSKPTLKFLRNHVSRDPDWRVQEILAKAFDNYCADVGYQQALPLIRDWLADPNPNVRRAVSEGLRIWTSRDYFRERPETAIALLRALRGDDSEYVRKSAGNALRDISRKHKQLVKRELELWDLSDRKVMQTYKLANKFIGVMD